MLARLLLALALLFGGPALAQQSISTLPQVATPTDADLFPLDVQSYPLGQRTHAVSSAGLARYLLGKIPMGPQGIPGNTGPAGPATQLSIGSTTTGAAGTPALVTIAGQAPAQTLSFTIPTGAAGPQGSTGPTGPAGPTGPQGNVGATGATGPPTTLSIGTVTTSAPGDPASASVSGAAPNQAINLTLPQGPQGPVGPVGPTGSGQGNVLGPSSATTAGDIAVFSDTTGTRLSDGGALGPAATKPLAFFLQAANNLSDLGSVSTARTNLGLGGATLLNVGTAAGTVAAGNDSRIMGALQGGNNLSDLASAAAARANLTAARSGANTDITSLSSLTSLTINKAASGQTNYINGQTAGLSRWLIAPGDGGAETGSNAGSDFRVFRYADNGAYIDGPLLISRATGVGSVADGLSAPNVAFTSGTINGTSIGVSTPAAGAFTTLSATTPLPVASGGTGGSTASTARSGLGAAASGSNSDITSLTGLTTALSVGQGGTGATSTSAALSNLGGLSSSTAAATYAPLASPALTGTPTAPTAAAGTNTTQVATTAFVATAVGSGGASGAPTLTDWRNGLVESAKTRPYIPMIGAAADGFFDQSGVDVANSVNATYDGTNKLYSNIDTSTKLLMHFDATPFTDDVGHPITTTGTGPSLTATSKFGAGAASFSGSGYLTATQTGTEFASLNQAGPWSVEMWIRPNDTTAAVRSFFGTAGFHIYQNGTALAIDNGAAASQSYSGVFTAGTYTKVEVTNSGGTIYVFSNGNLLGSAAAQAYATGNYVNIGGTVINGATYYFNGIGDELRISNVARHTSSYTVESSAFSLSGSALDLRSATFSAGFTPTKGSIFMVVNPTSGTITPGTNLIASLSQNGGSAYTSMPLTLSGTTLAGYPIYESNGVTLGGTGTQPKWRIQTAAPLGLQVRSVYFKEQ